MFTNGHILCIGPWILENEVPSATTESLANETLAKYTQVL